MTVVLLLMCVVAAAVAWRPDLPALTMPAEELVLMNGEILRSLENSQPSHRYPFLDPNLRRLTGPNIRVFGLQTKGDAYVTLHDSSEKVSDLRFTLSQGHSCTLDYLREKNPTNVAFPCNLILNGDEMTWFTLETTMNYVAVYVHGGVGPVLELSNHDLGDYSVNFNGYDMYSVSSEDEALWDFQGYELNRKSLVDHLADPFVIRGLKTVEEDLLKMKQQVWRCQYARKKKRWAIFGGRKYYVFIQRYCSRYVLQPYLDSIVRHEAILLVNGRPLPKASSYDVAQFFSQVH